MRNDHMNHTREFTAEQTLAGKSRATPVTRDIWRLKVVFVNVYFVAQPDGSWVLIDSGLPGAAKPIRQAAAELFGPLSRPTAIILTHGHFDHAGSARLLADTWDVPIFAHPLELPYLTGQSDYPPKDPTMGGAIAFMARFFPTHGYDFGNRIRPLPAQGQLPGLPDWHWMHTPGHSPGHISLFRSSDRTLIAGDALATMDLDSWRAMITYKRQFDRPAAPFTIDWAAARQSVVRLSDLEPAVVAAGHGLPMDGLLTPARVQELAETFDPPTYGRYIQAPAHTDHSGVRSVPPPVPDPLPKRMALVAAGLLGAAALWSRAHKRS